MEDKNSVQSSYSDEISLKDLIIKIQNWIVYLMRKWKIILLFCIIGAMAGFTYIFLQKPKYVGELTFVLEDSKPSSLGMYAGLASQFGIDIGGASGSGVFSGDNIMEFLKSRLMVERTLLSSIVINGKETSLANLYIDINSLRKKWDKEPILKDINFPTNAVRSSFSLLQDSVLNALYLDILGKNLNVTKPDKKLSFIAVSCTSENENFSKSFTETLVKEATDFYVQTKTKRSKTNVDKLQEKADSIEALLNKKTYSAANSMDMNLNPAKNVARVNTELITRDKIVLQTMYAEVVKNLEVSRMTMAQETPIIQIVDVPILPLKKEKKSKTMGIIGGGVLGAILALGGLIIRKGYKNIMS